MSATTHPAARVAIRPRGGRITGAGAALTTACVVFVLGAAGLIATHHSPRAPVPPAPALRDVLHDATTGKDLRGAHWTRLGITATDGRSELVTLYDRARVVAMVDVSGSGRVIDRQVFVRPSFGYGSNIANDGRVLALLTLVFVLMTGVWPLWRLRNLDVLVTASLVSSVVLFDQLTFERMVLASYPALLYLAGRCTWLALGRPRSRAPEVPLFEAVTSRWTDGQRARTLRLILVAALLITAMVGLSSLHVVDVGYAVMEGATAITHGLLPYGHVADIVHGDTYPIGSYLFYTPFAWLSPVHSDWDSADLTLLAAALGAGGVAWMLARAQAPISRDARIRTHSPEGLRTAIAWLTFPPVLLTVSTGSTDVLLAGFLLAALVLWQRSFASTAVLVWAAWFKLVALALLPIWLARLRKGALLRAVAACLTVSAALVSALLLLGGAGSLRRMLGGLGYQFTRQSPHVLWTFVGSVPLQQLVQAGTLALIAGAVVRVRRDPALAGDRTRVSALAAAVLLGLQLSANYWTFMYLVWVLPLLGLSILAERPGGVQSSAAGVQLALDTFNPKPSAADH